MALLILLMRSLFSLLSLLLSSTMAPSKRVVIRAEARTAVPILPHPSGGQGFAYSIDLRQSAMTIKATGQENTAAIQNLRAQRLWPSRRTTCRLRARVQQTDHLRCFASTLFNASCHSRCTKYATTRIFSKKFGMQSMAFQTLKSTSPPVVSILIIVEYIVLYTFFLLIGNAISRIVRDSRETFELYESLDSQTFESLDCQSVPESGLSNRMRV